MTPIFRQGLLRRIGGAAVVMALLTPTLRSTLRREPAATARAASHCGKMDFAAGAATASAPSSAGLSGELVTVHGRTDTATFMYDAEGGHWFEVSRSPKR